MGEEGAGREEGGKLLDYKGPAECARRRRAGAVAAGTTGRLHSSPSTSPPLSLPPLLLSYTLPLAPSLQ